MQEGVLLLGTRLRTQGTGTWCDAEQVKRLPGCAGSVQESRLCGEWRGTEAAGGSAPLMSPATGYARRSSLTSLRRAARRLDLAPPLPATGSTSVSPPCALTDACKADLPGRNKGLEVGKSSGVAEQPPQTPPIKAQSTAIARAMASICNAERGRLRGMSGHGGWLLNLSELQLAAVKNRPRWCAGLRAALRLQTDRERRRAVEGTGALQHGGAVCGNEAE